jgi:hypothetical protein
MSNIKNKFEIDKNTIFAIYNHEESTSYILFDDYDDYQAFENAIHDIFDMLGKASCRHEFSSLAFYANSLVYQDKYALPEYIQDNVRRKEELLTSYYLQDSYYSETRTPIFSSDYRIIGYHKSYEFYYSYESDDEWVDDPKDLGLNEMNSGNA